MWRYSKLVSEGLTKEEAASRVLPDLPGAWIIEPDGAILVPDKSNDDEETISLAIPISNQTAQSSVVHDGASNSTSEWDASLPSGGSVSPTPTTANTITVAPLSVLLLLAASLLIGSFFAVSRYLDRAPALPPAISYAPPTLEPTAQPSVTPYPTYTPAPTYTLQPTVVVVVVAPTSVPRVEYRAVPAAQSAARQPVYNQTVQPVQSTQARANPSVQPRSVPPASTAEEVAVDVLGNVLGGLIDGVSYVWGVAADTNRCSGYECK